MIYSILAFLNSPVPHAMSTPNDALYATVAIGGGFIAFCAWWAFCFIVRNGILGTRMALRIIQRKQKVNLRLVLLNNWKVHGDSGREVGPVDLREPL